MTTNGDEHERTMAFARIAFGQIKALHLPASPRNYEVWYAYATGYNPSLNQTINETIQRTGALNEDDLGNIYDTYLCPVRISDRIDTVGSRVMDEIEQVMAMVDTAVGTATSYTESLAGVTEQLSAAKDRDGLRAIVEGLVQTAKEMEFTNQKLEARLTASKQEINQLQENLEVVRNESLTDPLTSLANRKFFDQVLQSAIEEAFEKNQPLSLIMTDIDHFKKFNDMFGHLTGDQVLRLVALSMRQNVKGQDIAARYGGEEFAIILPNTVIQASLTVADHIRRAVMGKELKKRSTGENLGRVTLSLGVASLKPGDTAQALIGRADKCLYAAKRSGRNRVMCEADLEIVPQAQVA